MNDNNLHEWIQNYEEYEAVIRCTNTLPPWNPDQCLRGFQTFGWTDVSGTNDELEFCHTESGVIVLFDGDIVAFKFGINYEEFKSSFSDLFRVLNSLGWVDAVVYHSSNTMPALLKDFGAAIPASMQLDIKPAVEKKEIVSMKITHDLLTKGKSIVEDANNETIFNELNDSVDNPFDDQSLDDDVENMNETNVSTENQHSKTMTDMTTPPILPQPMAIPVTAVPRDDVKQLQSHGLSSLEHGVKEANIVIARQTNTISALNAELDSFKQQTSALLTEQNSLSESLALANEHALMDKNYTERIEHNLLEAQTDFKEVTIECIGLRDDLKSCHAEIKSLSDLYELNLKKSHDENAKLTSDFFELTKKKDLLVLENEVLLKKIKAFQSSTNGMPATFLLNNAHFIFDLPTSPFSHDDVVKYCADSTISHTEHIYVGEARLPVRWDLFGEHCANHPWFIENLVKAMGFENQSSIEMSKLILDAKKKNKLFDLRDFFNANRKNTVISSKLGSLLLCEAGDAIVDLKKNVNNESVIHKSFTVNGLASSTEPVLYVFHVDSLDNDFVVWLAQLLQFVIHSHVCSSIQHDLLQNAMDAAVNIVSTEHPAVDIVAPVDVVETSSVSESSSEIVKSKNSIDVGKVAFGEFLAEFGSLMNRYVGKV